jgi:hypothetical protein
VSRAAEFALKNRAMDLAHLSGGGFVFQTHDDAIGMMEILNRGAFAKDFGIGDDSESSARYYASRHSRHDAAQYRYEREQCFSR